MVTINQSGQCFLQEMKSAWRICNKPMVRASLLKKSFFLFCLTKCFMLFLFVLFWSNILICICKQAIDRIRFVDLAVCLLGFLGSVSRWCTLPKTRFAILHFMCASLLAFQREDRGQRRTSSSEAAAQPVSLVDCKWDERPPDSLSEPASVLHLRV